MEDEDEATSGSGGSGADGEEEASRGSVDEEEEASRGSVDEEDEASPTSSSGADESDETVPVLGGGAGNAEARRGLGIAAGVPKNAVEEGKTVFDSLAKESRRNCMLVFRGRGSSDD